MLIKVKIMIIIQKKKINAKIPIKYVSTRLGCVQ